MLDSAAVTHVVLSPHLDDAALSIGGLIAGFTAAGEAILVVTVAAGSPLPHMILSPFAAALHRAWGLSSTEAVARRRREDEAAMATLGAEARRLDQLDAVVRPPDRYGTEAALTGEVAGEDRLEIELIAALAPILFEPDWLSVRGLRTGSLGDHGPRATDRRRARRADLAPPVALRGRDLATGLGLASLAPGEQKLSRCVARPALELFGVTTRRDSLESAAHELLDEVLRAVDPEVVRGVGPAERHVATHWFSQLFRLSGDVEDVVGDLVRLADPLAEEAVHRAVLAGRGRSSGGRGLEERGRLRAAVRDDGDARLGLPGLPGDDPVGAPHAARDDLDQPSEPLRRGSRGARQRLEGEHDHRIPCEHGEGLTMNAVHCGLPAAQGRVVEAGEIVVHERGAVEQLDRRGSRVGESGGGVAAGRRDRDAKARTDARAGRKHRVFHRGDEPGRRFPAGHRLHRGQQRLLDTALATSSGRVGHTNSFRPGHRIVNGLKKC